MIHLKNMRQHHRPRLDRRNAMKNIDYDADGGPSTSLADPLSFNRKLLDQTALAGCTSFRFEGADGEVDEVFRFLGLGHEDFSIPVEAWEARKVSSLDADFMIPKLTNPYDDCAPRDDIGPGARKGVIEVRDELEVTSTMSIEPRIGDGAGVQPGHVETEDFYEEISGEVKNCVVSLVTLPPLVTRLPFMDDVEPSLELTDCATMKGGEAKSRGQSIMESDEVRERKRTSDSTTTSSGIRGCRPQKLALPPVIMHSVVDNTSSTWDILRSFGPQDDEDVMSLKPNGMCVEKEGKADVKLCSDISERESGCPEKNCSGNLVEEDNYIVPRSGSLGCKITSWQKGDFLGSGSFGTVYEGFTDDGFFFAVKEVSLLDSGCQGQQSIQQLEQEILLLRQFQHENIVRYLGTDKDDSKLYIFLELVTKGSLAKLYEKYQLQDSQVCVYTRQILCGLDYLHSRNVVHRDIKCANILVDVSGSVKLADFGLAKTTKLNDIKSCKGTPYWMAPEVVKNCGSGRSADIWSLGCTVLEMLSGQIPYSHLEGMQALFRIGCGELPRMPTTLSKDARDFILQCLRVNPDERPTAAQLLEHPFVKKQQPRSSPPSSLR